MEEYSLSLKGITFIQCKAWLVPCVTFLRKQDLMLPRAALSSSFSDLYSLINMAREKAHEICILQSFYSS